MAIGKDYYSPSDYSWGSEISNNADLVVEGKVGIGVLKPEKELHVAGDAKIENDLNVEGDTQLGDASSDKTTVKGDLKVEGGVAVGDVTNMGAGTINAQKIYVNGSEIGGGEVVVVWDRCTQVAARWESLSCNVNVNCPDGYNAILCFKSDVAYDTALSYFECSPNPGNLKVQYGTASPCGISWSKGPVGDVGTHCVAARVGVLCAK